MQVDELNNPVNDSMKARDLLNDEVAAWNQLSKSRQEIYYQLLHESDQFKGFFKYIGCYNCPSIVYVSRTCRTRELAQHLVSDLDKHFILLNQTKLSISEIQQVWKAIKDLTAKRDKVSCSPLDIARQAGWGDDVEDIETRVKAAIAALEDAGFIQRGSNSPHVFATGIAVKNMDEARRKLTISPLFDEQSREEAARIIKSLISARATAEGRGAEAESRVDYLADI